MWGGAGENPEKTTWHTHKRIWFVSHVNVRLINWAATYDEVFIVLVMFVAKAILLFFQLLHFITCCVMLHQSLLYIAGIYDGAYTDRQFLNIHIHVQYITQTFDVLNLPAFYM